MICAHQAHKMVTPNGDETLLGCSNCPPSCRDEVYIDMNVVMSSQWCQLFAAQVYVIPT